jgi:alpha-tubulin suppressor-like RCC1 family protein
MATFNEVINANPFSIPANITMEQYVFLRDQGLLRFPSPCMIAWGDNTTHGVGHSTQVANTKKAYSVYRDTKIKQIGTSSASLSLAVQGAVDVNDRILTWGYNGFSALLRGGTNWQISYTTVANSTGAEWHRIFGAYGGMTGLKTNGEFWAIGTGGSGQFGQGSTSNVTTWQRIGTDTYTMISHGNQFTFLVKTDGTLVSAGANSSGKTGQGTTSGNTLTFTPVTLGSGVTNDNWVQISTNTSTSLFRKADGSIYSTGASNNNGLGVTMSSVNRVGGVSSFGWTDISAGSGHSVGIKDGVLYGWGGATNKRLNTLTSTQTFPAQIHPDNDWSKVACGVNGTIAMKTNGDLYYFGAAAEGLFATDVGATMIGSVPNTALVSAGSAGYYIAY